MLPFVEPWISSQDVVGGKQWNPQLEQALATCHGAIFCMTADNLESAWLNFEAGGIALRPDKPLVVPFLFNIPENRLQFPLAQFQARSATLIGTKALIKDIVYHAQFLGFDIKDNSETISVQYPVFKKKLLAVQNAFGMSINTRFKLPTDFGLDYTKIIDGKTSEVIITGQNIQGLIRNNFFSFLNQCYLSIKDFKVLIILTIPAFFNVLSSNPKHKKEYEMQFKHTIKHLIDFKLALPVKLQKNFTVYFHPGVSSLTAIFRDPSSLQRGLIAIIPKWATDSEPENRIFCLIDRANNDLLFRRVYGHIGIMNDAAHSKTLEDMKRWAKL